MLQGRWPISDRRPITTGLAQNFGSRNTRRFWKYGRCVIHDAHLSGIPERQLNAREDNSVCHTLSHHCNSGGLCYRLRASLDELLESEIGNPVLMQMYAVSIHCRMLGSVQYVCYVQYYYYKPSHTLVATWFVWKVANWKFQERFFINFCWSQSSWAT